MTEDTVSRDTSRGASWPGIVGAFLLLLAMMAGVGALEGWALDHGLPFRPTIGRSVAYGAFLMGFVGVTFWASIRNVYGLLGFLCFTAAGAIWGPVVLWGLSAAGEREPSAWLFSSVLMSSESAVAIVGMIGVLARRRGGVRSESGNTTG